MCKTGDFRTYFSVRVPGRFRSMRVSAATPGSGRGLTANSSFYGSVRPRNVVKQTPSSLPGTPLPSGPRSLKPKFRGSTQGTDKKRSFPYMMLRYRPPTCRNCGKNTSQCASSVDVATKSVKSEQISSAPAPMLPSRAVIPQMRQQEHNQ